MQAISGLLLAVTWSVGPAQQAIDLRYGLADLRTVTANGTELTYIERGAGPPIVLVHGQLSDFRFWKRLIEAADDRYRVIAYSRRYFFPNVSGRTLPQFQGPRDVPDLIAFIEALKLGPVHLIGHSAGGHTALLAAIERPDLVRSLVLAEGGFLTQPGVENAGARASMQARALLESGQGERAVRTFIDAATGEGTFDRMTTSERQALLDNRMALGAPLAPLKCDDVRRLQPPTMLVRGDSSPPFLQDAMQALAACLPAGERVTIPKASHDMYLDNPEAFNSAALQFIDRNERLASPRTLLLGEPARVAPGIVSSEFTEIRAAEGADGKLMLWGSTNRPGGAGGWDLWLSRRGANGWSAPQPVPFNSAANDFDPAFSPDGRWVYFFSNRPGGLGGDDIYRVAVKGEGFGTVEPLGPEVNSKGNEWAPALSPDGATLLFASNGRGGRGRHDLLISRAKGEGWAAATLLSGAINTAADEFDATFLADGRSIVFTRSLNVESERVSLYFSSPDGSGSYGVGTPLPLSGTLRDADALGPAVTWRDTSVLLFTAATAGSRPDIYEVRYRLR
jgi:TolB protein